MDSAQNARAVREDTAELATYQLADQSERRNPSFLSRRRSFSTRTGQESLLSNAEAEEEAEPGPEDASHSIDEILEAAPEEAETVPEEGPYDEGPSLLSRALRRSPPETPAAGTPPENGVQAIEAGTAAAAAATRGGADPGTPRRSLERAPHPARTEEALEHTETTPLLGAGAGGHGHTNGALGGYDLESQKTPMRRRLAGYFSNTGNRAWGRILNVGRLVSDPKRWDRRALWENVVVAPVACLPAVIVGLLLNILDALSYGMLWYSHDFFCSSMLTLCRRHDPLPSREPHLRRAGLCRHIHLLRQHNCIPACLLVWKYLQRRYRFRIGRSRPHPHLATAH